MEKAGKEKKKKRNAYHRYFEDYTERKVTDPKTGKTRIEHVYSGWYYSPCWRKLKTGSSENFYGFLCV